MEFVQFRCGTFARRTSEALLICAEQLFPPGAQLTLLSVNTTCCGATSKLAAPVLSAPESMLIAKLVAFCRPPLPLAKYCCHVLAIVVDLSLGHAKIFGVFSSFCRNEYSTHAAPGLRGSPGSGRVPSCGSRGVPGVPSYTRHGTLTLSPSFTQTRTPSVICFKLLTQVVRLARSFAFANAGNSSAAKMAMMAITTSNSIRVNARFSLRFRIIQIRVGFRSEYGTSFGRMSNPTFIPFQKKKALFRAPSKKT